MASEVSKTVILRVEVIRFYFEIRDFSLNYGTNGQF